LTENSVFIRNFLINFCPSLTTTRKQPLPIYGYQPLASQGNRIENGLELCIAFASLFIVKYDSLEMSYI